MCTVVHLEPEDFARELVHNQKNVYARTYVLDCGLAVVIYMCQDSHFLYYLDTCIMYELWILLNSLI